MIAEISTSAIPAINTQAKFSSSIALRKVAAIRAPGLNAALFHVLDALNHSRVFGTVFVPDRFDGVLKSFLVCCRYLNDLNASGFGLVHGLLLVDRKSVV